MCWNPLSVVVCSVVFCAFLDFAPSRVLASVSVKANYDYGENYKVGQYKQKLTLHCSIEGSQDSIKYMWKWFKGREELKTDDAQPHHIEVNENSLVVNRFVEQDAGEYTCKLYNPSNKDQEVDLKLFNVILKPYLKLPKTATFIEGEKMELECVVFGKPTPEVSWRFENSTLVPDGNVKFVANKRNISNAILVMNSINMTNRGNFYCTGKNFVFLDSVVSDPSYVRIKDKMAALWPFLGICAEVIILCLIIFIYEKKRNKAEFEESDTDQGPETNNAKDHSGGDVRHRK